MKVSELKELVPVKNVFELQGGTRYLVQLVRSLSQAKVNAVLVEGSEIKFYELSD